MNAERIFNAADTVRPVSGNKVCMGKNADRRIDDPLSEKLMTESQEQKRQEMGGNEWEARSEWSITVGCAGHGEKPCKEATRLSPQLPSTAHTEAPGAS